MKPRYLTKSKFQLAMECPTKLYYCDKPEYSNLKLDNSFLQALAESGFQVAELAKAYYPEGVNIASLNDEEAIAKTKELLQKDNVTIFEAAIGFENLFIRIDILIKNNDHLTFIEVKSKSIDHEDLIPFFTKRKPIKIDSKWKPYVFDAAFQKFVLSKTFPDCKISSYLMLVDKDAICQTNGLNQKFRITQDEKGRVKILSSNNLTQQDLSHSILKKVKVSSEMDFIFNEMKFNEMKFSEYVDYLSEHYKNDIKIRPILGAQCRKCEFKLDPKETNPNLKSGFLECWSEICGLKENEPTILDVWDFKKAGDLLKEGVYRISQLTKEDINPEPNSSAGMTDKQRRWIQIEKIINKDTSVRFEKELLQTEMQNWTYPLHFIDFETAMPAIPFNKGERPCQGLAFQFSHHIMHEDGLIEHVGQYINDKIGVNPNIDFIRALKSNLENSSGMIFRYSNHENTYLNMIHDQLQFLDIPDKQDLISFIEQIAQPTDANEGKWMPGPRNMVDLCELVKRYYYDPLTKGSNSIKKVFPAILQRSSFLQVKYGKPIYGAEGGIKSLNFTNWQWIKKEGDKIVDPYELLPPLFEGVNLDEEHVELLFHDEKLKEGGSASIAYARMQFSEMSDVERKKLREALLKYCELDTLAMVMIVEGWREVMFGKDKF